MATAVSRPSTCIVCISDTHSAYDFTLPNGDILVHAGDWSHTGKYDELEKFLSWLKTLKKFRLKVIIAGNHDVTLDREFYEKDWRRFHTSKQDVEKIRQMFIDPKLRSDYGIIYLQDETFIDPVSQLKFYGSPWQPEFCAWGFNVERDSTEIRSIWEKIPLDTDILLTHGPPYGILDTTSGKEHVGCRHLFERVQLVRPKLHVFGHIHEAYGRKREKDNPTLFVNASTCNLRYQAVQPPIVVDI